DGGMARGQRYFVMELIDGCPITEYCARHDLPLHDRLRLFEDVCAAIHYAHQRMILHRDLKPANIWVNSSGIVKILDFGIAQILDAEHAAGAKTLTGMSPVSLASASPEQVRGENLGFPSDVYSLGLLLYEILTGENPQTAGPAMDSLMRRILEDAPVPPSRKLPALPRDLDAIVLKALEKNPERRYPSAADLGDDVRRLRQGHPVTAVAPSWSYRLRRFVLRHKAAVAASALLLLVIAAAGVNSLQQARREERRFSDARRLIRDVIFEIQPGLQRVPGSVELRRKLIASTLRYLESVSQDAAGNPSLLRELARAYVEMAKVQGSPGWASLGNPSLAKDYLLRAEKLIEQALAAAPSDPLVLIDATKVYTGLVYHGLPDARYAAKAVHIAQQRLARNAEDSDALEDLGGAYFAEGQCLRFAFDSNAAGAYLRAAEAYRKLLIKKPGNRQLRRNVALTERYRAQIALEENRKDDLLQHARAASEISERILAEDPDSQVAQVDAATDTGMLASALSRHGLPLEAASARRRSISLKEAILRADPANSHAKLLLAVGDRDFCFNLTTAGDLSQADHHCTRSFRLWTELERDGKLRDSDRLAMAMSQSALGQLRVKQKRPAEACPLLAKALATFEESLRKTPGAKAIISYRTYARRAFASCPP
ncbi:MAG: serine/threonine protein kinase, partial [Bryobacterales bacterium]|nr:serine/threonine protein kinase [Bryobacterales bacterium]